MSTDTTTFLQTSQAAVTKSLQVALDGASKDLKHWRAVIPFLIRASHAPGSLLNVPSDSHECEDILEYLRPMYKGYKIYFSDKYSASISSGGGWKELLKDLAIAGMQGGFYLIGNGSYKDKHIVVCRGSRLYQGTKRQQLSPSQKPQYRNETLPTLADTSLAVKPTKETCLNYDVSTINLALRRSNFSDVEPNRTFFV
jgi:hypothetical protein